MSSTNRGGDRHASDYYITPQPEIHQFMHRFMNVAGVGDPRQLTWLDPCAGGDARDPAAYPTAMQNLYGVDMQTYDVREDSRAETIGNYLEMSNLPKVDMIVSNPPFSHAHEFILKAMSHLSGGGHVAYLLRLNFFGSDVRKAMFKTLGLPRFVFVHPDRISFTEDCKTDSIEYAHFVWQKRTDGRPIEFSQLCLLDGFTKAERNQHRADKRARYAAPVEGRLL